MTNAYLKIKDLIKEIEADSGYQHWKEGFLEEIKNYDNKINLDKYFIGSTLLKLAEQNNWGRRSTLAFAKSISMFIVDNNTKPDLIIDDIADFLTGLQAECAPQAVVRFKWDPDNSVKLWTYVHTEQWLDEEFYSEKK